MLARSFIVKIFNYNANPFIKSNMMNNNTPLKIARDKGFTKIETLLKEYINKIKTKIKIKIKHKIKTK